MAIVCPTVTATTKEDYDLQLRKIVPLANRIHIDLMDGMFAPNLTLTLQDIWWPAGIQADLHIMYKTPEILLDTIIKMRPSLAIFHAEAEGDFVGLSSRLRKAGIKVGLALLERTQITQIVTVLPDLDHVLVFSGHLGHFGGQADLEMLQKVRTLKTNYPKIEVGWDGGINNLNVKVLTLGGVDVLNTGGFIQKSDNPLHAYATLKAIASNPNSDD
ncbi:MAG TPA: hypothetical protein VJC09_03035 [Candidatus Saccharimonadales bacterium]|nr:hypothetical protein [Candidatus Saccharimonadales bacterium]